MDYEKITFEELSKLPSGTKLADYFEENVRILILRGPGSICAYLGIPIDHPLAGFDYNDLPIDCHGGLTFGSKGGDPKEVYPDGYYWYGLDYAHLGDKSFYSLEIPKLNNSDDKEWTVKEVKQDLWSTIYEFKKLIKIAEKIKNS